MSDCVPALFRNMSTCRGYSPPPHTLDHRVHTCVLQVVSYAAGLANYFGTRYDAGKALSLPLAPAATFGGCVPSYVGVLVLSGVVERAKQQGVLLHPLYDRGLFSEETVDRVIASVLLALPAVAGAVAARQVCTMGDMAIVAGKISRFVFPPVGPFDGSEYFSFIHEKAGVKEFTVRTSSRNTRQGKVMMGTRRHTWISRD